MQKYDTLDAYWHDIHDIPTLTDDEERALAERIQAGDEKALDKLVTSNLRFVVSIARQYSMKSEDVSIDDLISEGNIALMLAARKWSPEKEPRFISYASHDVKRAIQKAMPQQENALTLDAPAHPGQTNTLGDMQKAGKPLTDDATYDHEYGNTLAIAMRYLNDREKEVIRHFYGVGTEDTMTMAEIGDKLGLKRERIRQIRKTAERKMRRIIKKK
jgi:RNA polymerase primary sigma factor